jgi:hypothetical protein
MLEGQESYASLDGVVLEQFWSEWHVTSFIDEQLDTVNFLLPPLRLPQVPDRIYHDNQHLWSDILKEKLFASVVLRLDGFFLFDWFPRSPGLFHTDEAAWQRKAAMGCLTYDRYDSDLVGIDEASQLQQEESIDIRQETPDFMQLFNPYGKALMLRGGVGCIRLQPHAIEGEEAWFMSASSTPEAHEGIPVAVPGRLYQRYYDQIRTDGVLLCRLVGRLKYVPKTLEWTYDDYGHVPLVYLYTEEIEPINLSAAGEGMAPRASVAVGFLSSYEHQPSLYATYVTFYPGIRGSLRRRLDWLENEYVQGMYRGKIVMDFDERMKRFEYATFAKRKVMNGGLHQSEIQAFFNELGMPVDAKLLIDKQNQVFTGDKYDIAVIRQLLLEAFRPSDLKRLCLDHRELRPIDHRFGPKHSLEDMVDQVIDYCRTKLVWDELLDAVRKENPRQYARVERDLHVAGPEQPDNTVHE